MTSDRCYKKGITPTRALEILYNEGSVESDRDLMQRFIRCVGIYPVGSLVELDSGALGVVVASHMEVRIWPVVLLVRQPDGAPYEQRELLNLAAVRQHPHKKLGTRIRRVLNARDTDINVRAIITAHFGL